MDIGNNIYFLRRTHNLTQQELGAAVYVSKAMICKYETGVARIPIDVLIRIADLFGVTLDELAGRT